MAKREERKKSESTAKKESEGVTQTEFDKLLRFILTFQGRFALAFICGEDRRQRQGILASLTDLLKEKGVELRHIDLTYREATDLLGTLREECQRSANKVIVVTGIEASLRGRFLASLNLQRDLISQDIKCPLLFWVSAFALNLFAREAPDFHDFRHTVFNFKGAERKEVPTDTAIRASEIRSEEGRGSEERTAYLLAQLEKYQRDEDSLALREKLAYAELLEEIARGYRGERHRTEALVYLEKALDIYKRLKERGREASVLQAIGDIYYFSDNQSKARQNLEKALLIHREIGSRLGEANVLQGLGHVKRMQGDYTEAEALYLRALGIYSALDDRYSQGITLLSMVEVYKALSASQKARSSARRARELLASFPKLVERCDKLLQQLGSTGILE